VDAGTRRAFLVGLALVVVIAGAAVVFLGGGAPAPPSLPTGTQEFTGVIVAVDSAGLGDVRGVTVRATDGTLASFSLEQLQNATEFPPGHLAEHQATAEPVSIRYVERDGVNLALRIDDAPAPSGSRAGPSA
jgi:hypothetical protein